MHDSALAMTAEMRYENRLCMGFVGRRAEVLLLLLATAGCSEDAVIRADEVRAAPSAAPNAGAGATIDCGVVAVTLALMCGERSLSRDETLALEPSTLDPVHARAATPPFECDAKAASLAPELAASLESWCAPPVDLSESFVSVVHLRASASAVCSFEGTTRARVTPRWAGRMVLPEGRFRISARSTSDELAPCVLSVAGAPSDPLALGPTRLALAFVEGPALVPLELECSEPIVGASCENPGVEPPNRSAAIDLELTATPSP